MNEMANDLLDEEVEAAMEDAVYETLPSGLEYVEIPGEPGLWGTGETRAQATADLRDVVREFIRLRSHA